MKDKFDYKESLTDIKASLFDIYEDQEKKIGILDDALKEQYVNDFIEVKDLALVLLEKIQKLYSISDDLEKENTEDISSSIEEEPLDSELEYEDTSSLENDTLNDELSFGSEDDLIQERNEDRNISNKEQIEEISNEDLKYHLICDEKKLNFAYVSEDILEKMKSFQRKSNVSSQKIFSSTVDFNKVYKKDDLVAKGIIVRNDQYMKLALSKHRQEGILEEAKVYRIEEVRKKRQEQQKIELEKAKVHLDI